MANKDFIKKFSYDTLLNIVSYGLPILMLQLLVFPFIAKEWGVTEYGEMLALTAIINVAAEMVGGTLANVRLIKEEEYKNKGIVGDYKRLFILGASTFLIILLFVSNLLFKQDTYCLVLLSSYYLLFTLRSYLSVSYRIILNYKSVFVNNILLCVGYGIGLGMSSIFHHWAYVFIIGYTLAIVHILFTTRIWQEPFNKTEFYSATRNKYISLSGAYLVGNSMNYFDRIFLMATIGATGVSNYYISGVFGKVLNLLTAPINMVMLSYLSKKKSIAAHEIITSIALLLGLVSLFVFAANLFALNVIQMLYPDYVDKARPLVLICTLATVLTACTTFFKTLSMRYNSGKSVLLTEIVYIVSYLGLAVSFTTHWGVKGFCWSIIIAAVIRISSFTVLLLKKSHV